MEKNDKRIKAFIITHYAILAITFVLSFVNTKLPDWLYKEYNAFDYFLWYYEKFAFLFLIPVLFFSTIAIMIYNHKEMESISPFIVSLVLDFVVGLYAIIIYVARF